MKITNKYELPLVLVETLQRQHDDYDPGRPEGCERYITATQLSRPPLMNTLLWRHGHEVVYDASELIITDLGSRFHYRREMLSDGGVVLQEERLYGKVNGWTISSKLDCYDPRCNTLSDYKTVKEFSVKGEMKDEWYWQLQVGGWLLRQHGFEVEKLEILAVIKDFSPMKARFDPSYPQVPVKVLHTAPLPMSEVESWIAARLAELEQDPPRPCTDEERWVRGGSVAAMKRGRKRAVKLFNSQKEASDWVAGQSDANEFYFENRKKECIRCEFYCKAAPWCPVVAAEAPESKVTVAPDGLPF